MNRKDFLKLCGILGVGIPAQAAISGCSKDFVTTKFSGKVIIIGAGPGGMSAAYLLQQLGVDYEVLEASNHVGGRIRTDDSFADFPIPLGAEWLETEVGVLQDIVNDASVDVQVTTTFDNPDFKFVNSSWLDFFESYILPSIADKIQVNKVVTSIEYGDAKVKIGTKDNTYESDAVFVSVPLKVLQDGHISFTPTLPSYKTKAIQEAEIWSGFKAFIEFKSDFYGDGHSFDIQPETDGQKLYYDATFGQASTKNILGLFTIGKPAEDYTNLQGDVLRDYILKELDGLFDNKATPNYVNHIVQNWNDEPFIQGGYLSDHADWKLVRDLGKSIDNKVFFAGGPYSDGNDWVSVHVAAASAKTAVEALVS